MPQTKPFPTVLLEPEFVKGKLSFPPVVCLVILVFYYTKDELHQKAGKKYFIDNILPLCHIPYSYL